MEYKEQPAPRVYLETYGCQMNIADSELIAGILGRAGYARAESADTADVILLNTCAIREHAEERVLGRMSDLARLKQSRPHLRLGLLGCMAQHNRAELLRQAPYIDLVAGPDSYRRLPQMLDHDAGARAFEPLVEVRLDRTETYADLEPRYEGQVRAYVTVMRGCDRFCTFCVVPYVRGRERSLPPESICRELSRLAERGVKEVVMLGQTVNAYRFAEPGCAEVDFAELLRRAARIDGIERLRFTSPHPSDMSEPLIEALASEPKLQPYLHLPVQSGSDRILAAMDRGYMVDEYLRLVERLRGAIPGLALSTDIIVGFHGEEHSDFEATLALMRAVGFDSAFTFKYSVREQTRAYKLGDSVSEAEKQSRLSAAIALQEAISLERNQAHLGQAFKVLIEGPARRGGAMLAGKTPQFKTAIFAQAPGLAAGDTVAVRITAATSHSLLGEAVPALTGAGREV